MIAETNLLQFPARGYSVPVSGSVSDVSLKVKRLKERAPYASSRKPKLATSADPLPSHHSHHPNFFAPFKLRAYLERSMAGGEDVPAMEYAIDANPFDHLQAIKAGYQIPHQHRSSLIVLNDRWGLVGKITVKAR